MAYAYAMYTDYQQQLKKELDEHVTTMGLIESIIPNMAQAAERLDRVLKEDAHLFICGNGGSAADSQHWAAEWRGKLHRDRRPLRATALSVDTSTITAVANDYGYEYIFERQLRALARPGDVIVAISTSGNSPNVLKAAEAAHAMQVDVIGLTGEGGGKLAALSNILIAVPSKSTQRIQEAHGFIMHAICELNDAALGD